MKTSKLKNKINKTILVCFALLLIVSCKRAETNNRTNDSNENKILTKEEVLALLPAEKIIPETDPHEMLKEKSLLPGMSFVLSKQYIVDSLINKNIFDGYGIDTYNQYISPYLVFDNWINGEIQEWSLNENVSLQLKKESGENPLFQKVMLYTLLDEIVTDSIPYYRFEYEDIILQNEPEPDFTRNEFYSYQSGNLLCNLLLEVYQTEGWVAVQVKRWNIYEINPETGKIQLLITLLDRDNYGYDYSIFKNANPDIVGTYEIDYEDYYIAFRFIDKVVYIEVNRPNPYIGSDVYTVEYFSRHTPDKGVDTKWVLTKGNIQKELRRNSGYYWLVSPEGSHIRMDEINTLP